MPPAKKCDALRPRHLRPKGLQITRDCRLAFGGVAHLGCGFGKVTVRRLIVGSSGQARRRKVALQDGAADFGRQVRKDKGETVAVMGKLYVIPLQSLANAKGR